MKKYYRELPGYPGYYVSKWGRIYSTHSHKHIRMGINKHRPNYLVPQVHIRGRTRILSRLVALAWVPNPDNKPCVCHKDNNPMNNHYTNLYWGTYKENMEQCINDGRFRPKGKIPLTKDKIFELIKDYESGMDRKKIQSKYQVKSTRIYKLVRKYSSPKFGNYRNLGKHQFIIKDYLEGMKIKDICKKYNIGHSTINNCRRRFNIPPR